MKILFILLFYAVFDVTFCQQIIGSFPEINGGFEEESDTLIGVGGISSTYTNWTTQYNLRGFISDKGGRSGPSFAVFTHNISEGTPIARLHTPTTIISNNTKFIIQFYYKGDFNRNDTLSSQLRGGISWSTSASPVYSDYDTNPNTEDVWTKYAELVTTGNNTPDISVGIISVRNNVEFYIDDFVIYPDSVIDIERPNDPTSPLITPDENTGELTVSWSPPVIGTDGGGYLVVRKSNSPPSGTPLENGIYAVNNLIDDGVVAYIGTESSFVDQNISSDTYYYKIFTVDKAFNYSDGVIVSTITDISENIENTKFKFFLGQNYPNPFNPATMISYTISQGEETFYSESFVQLKVYDILGKEVATLVNDFKLPGNYQIEFSSNRISSSGALSAGIYYYTLKAGNFNQTRKMILLK